MAVFDNSAFDAHEGVHHFHDHQSGLRAIIALHSTRLGPGAGGTRFWQYASDEAALTDALRLSKAMSFKNAMAGIPFGGGKGVILRPEGNFNRKDLFAAYGRAVDQLGGRYCTAEDVGVSPDDMKVVREQTRYVGGLDDGVAASGDPSPVTAQGVFGGMSAAVEHALGQNNFKGLRVAVQGLGHVGSHLCRLLHGAGAHLWVADINAAQAQKAEAEFGAEIVDPDAIHAADVEVFAPCALGGSVNNQSVGDIRAKIVAGGANNQLESPEMGQSLLDRKILYCPDYVINGGGIINVASELTGTYDRAWVDDKVEGLSQTLREIFARSDVENRPTNLIADQMAQHRINHPT